MATWARDQDFPSWFANAVGKALSLAAHGFLLTQPDSTHVAAQAPAVTGDDGAMISIKGLWRWNEAPLTVAHPGGAAGSYPIFVTGKAQNIVSTPAPNTDATDYTFGLVILAPATTPTIVAGVVDVYRRVGTAFWSGTAITGIVQLAPPVGNHAVQHAAGGPDALAPAAIGAATATALAAEIARAEASEPTAGELAALAGTSGSPGSGNKYVTNGDSRNANARTPTAHAASHEAGGSDALIGPWQALALDLSPVVSGVNYTPSARLEFGDTVRLKGVLKNSSGGTIAGGTGLASLPVALEPTLLAIDLKFPIGGDIGGAPLTGLLGINAGGVIYLNVGFPNNATVDLDGVTFTLS